LSHGLFETRPEQIQTAFAFVVMIAAGTFWTQVRDATKASLSQKPILICAASAEHV